MRVTLVYLTFDGIDSFYCGVGALAQYYLYDLIRIREELAAFGIELDLHVCYSRVGRESPFFSNEIAVRSRELAAAAGASLHELDPAAETENPFGARATWPSLCEAAVETLDRVARRDAFLLVLANDTPFAGMLPMLAQSPRPRRRVVWLMQSTAKLWAHPDHLPLESDRVEWEQSGIAAAGSSDDMVLGSTSDFMRVHLRSEWGVPDEAIVNYRQGVSPEYLRRFFARAPLDHQAIAASIGDARGRPILLSFGRAAWYKGLDIACSVAAEMAEQECMYPIICATDYGTGDSRRILQSLRAEYGLAGDRGRILTNFPFDLPKHVMRHPDLRVVLVPSRRENLSAIPTEARILNAGRAVVVASAVGGLTEQVQHGSDGFVFDPDDPSSAAKICAEISAMPGSCLASIASEARTRVARDYVLGENLARSMQATLSECEGVALDVRKDLRLGR